MGHTRVFDASVFLCTAAVIFFLVYGMFAVLHVNTVAMVPLWFRVALGAVLGAGAGLWMLNQVHQVLPTIDAPGW